MPDAEVVGGGVVGVQCIGPFAILTQHKVAVCVKPVRMVGDAGLCHKAAGQGQLAGREVGAGSVVRDCTTRLAGDQRGAMMMVRVRLAVAVAAVLMSVAAVLMSLSVAV